MQSVGKYMTKKEFVAKLGNDKKLVLIPALDNEEFNTWKILLKVNGDELCTIKTHKNASEKEVFSQIYELVVLSSELVEGLKLS